MAATDFVTNILSQTLANPVGLVLNIVISTIVGGIVFLIVVELIAKAFKDHVSIGRVFTVVLVINLVNILGVMGFVLQHTSFVPVLVIQLLVWIVLTKLFVGMPITHSIIVGIVGFFVANLVVPGLVPYIWNFIPIK